MKLDRFYPIFPDADWIERTLPMHVVRRVAAVLFFGFGAVAIVLALT